MSESKTDQNETVTVTLTRDEWKAVGKWDHGDSDADWSAAQKFVTVLNM